MNAPFCCLPYPSLSSPKHFPCCGMLNDGVSTGTLLGSQEKVLPRPDCFWECNGEAAPPIILWFAGTADRLSGLQWPLEPPARGQRKAWGISTWPGTGRVRALPQTRGRASALADCRVGHRATAAPGFHL